jgi:hypothetical protein
MYTVNTSITVALEHLTFHVLFTINDLITEQFVKVQRINGVLNFSMFNIVDFRTAAEV